MSSQNLKNKSIDELREMKAKGEAELKVLYNQKPKSSDSGPLLFKCCRGCYGCIVV